MTMLRKLMVVAALIAPTIGLTASAASADVIVIDLTNKICDHIPDGGSTTVVVVTAC